MMIDLVPADLSSPFWAAVANHLWQATFFGLVLAAVLLVARRASASTRFLLGWLGLLKFALPSLLLVWSLETLRVPVGTASPALLEWVIPFEAAAAPPVPAFPEAVPEVYPDLPGPVAAPAALSRELFIWWLVFLGIAGLWGVRLVRFRAFLQSRTEPFPDFLDAELDRVRLKAGVGRRVRGLLCRERIEPGVFGLFRPVLVVPGELVSELTPEELESIFLHELIHVRRHDNLFQLLRMVVRSAFWFHPLVWWFDRRLAAESERACDEAVLRISGRSRAYARSICKTSYFCLGLDMPGFSGISGNGTVRRLRYILGFEKHGRSRRTSVILLCSCIALFLGSSYAGALRLPVSASPVQAELSAEPMAGRKATQPTVEKEQAVLIEAISREMATDPEAALTRLEQASADSGASVFEYLLGSLYYRRDNLENAITHFRRAIELFPDYLNAHRNLGILYLRSGSWQQSREHLTRSLELGGSDADVLGLLGYVHSRLEEWMLAEQFYREALARQPAGPRPTDPYEEPVEEPGREARTEVAAAEAAAPAVDEMAATVAQPVLAPERKTLFEPDEVDRFPRPLERVSPEYPRYLARTGIRGRVVLDFIVDESGSPAAIRIREGDRTEFEQAAVQALARWRFEPAMKGGEAVSVRMVLPFRFDLDAWAETRADPPRVDAEPRLIRSVTPVYPQNLARNKIEGKVTVLLTIDERGRVMTVNSAEADRPEFASAALAAVEQWKFTPAIRGGRPTRAHVNIPVVFRLDGANTSVF